MRHLTKLGIAVLVVAQLGLAAPALAIDAMILNDGQDYVGRIIVITDPRSSSGGRCGESISLYNAVIINPGGGPAIVTIVAIDPGIQIKAGDRFDVIFQGTCDDQYVLTLNLK